MNTLVFLFCFMIEEVICLSESLFDNLIEPCDHKVADVTFDEKLSVLHCSKVVLHSSQAHALHVDNEPLVS